MATGERTIELRGVRVHNLRAIDLDLPLHRLIVLCGVSGAGKTSLAFDTLCAEGQRRYVDGFSTFSRQFLEQFERPDADRIERIPPAVAIRAPHRRPSQRTTVALLADLQHPLQMLFTRLGTIVCPDCKTAVSASSAAGVRTFIESLPAGIRVQVGFAAPVPPPSKGADRSARRQWSESLRARGFGRIILAGETRTIDEALAALPTRGSSADAAKLIVVLDRLKSGAVSAERLDDSLELALAEGSGGCVVLVEETAGAAEPAAPAASSLDADGRTWRVHRFWSRPICAGCRREFVSPEPRLFNCNTSLGACPACRGRGTVPESPSASGARAKRTAPCPDCRGSRFHPLALAVRVGGLNVAEWCCRSVRQVLGLLDELPAAARPTAPIESIAAALSVRLRHLDELALGHVSLDRSVGTLSAVEIKRTLLAAALSSHLVNMLVVVDEPTAGLHGAERGRLLAKLRALRDAPNTVVVVEHDGDVVRAADWMIDLGPGAGSDGGRVVYAGPPTGVREVSDSVTAARLFRSEPARAQTRDARREPTGRLRLEGVCYRNLQRISVDFPLGVLCAVTGASGSGKRSLVMGALAAACENRLSAGSSAAALNRASERDDREARSNGLEFERPSVERVTGVEQLKQLVVVDETSLGRTSRSIVATSLGVFLPIRTLFADSNEAQVKNFGASHFSFNASTGGGCPACGGTGFIAVDMQFLPDVSMTCPDCHGTRYRREILDVKYRGLNLAEILGMTVRDAFVFFRGQSRIQRRLKRLKDVGLDYLTLGRPTLTLSHGEAQRLKLAAGLAGGMRPGTLCLIEEPSAGLHAADLDQLVVCFDAILEGGNSLIVIDNRPELLAAADWVIELGSGAEGGNILQSGAVPQQ